MSTELPSNMMSIITTITNKVGALECTFSTTAVVQTHLISELERVIKVCWQETRAQESLKEES